MHIELNLSTQKIASNVKRKFLKEELDWILNKMILRFTENAITPDAEHPTGFEENIINTDKIRTLILNDHPLYVYKKINGVPYVLANLPGDYMHMIAESDRSGVVRDCNSNFATANAFENKYEYLYYLKIVKTPKLISPFYTGFSLTSGGINLVNPNRLPSSLEDRDMSFVIQDALRSELLQGTSNFRIYWERYNDIFKSETFIFVSDTNVPDVTLTYDGTATIAEKEILSVFKPNNVTAQVFKPNRLLKSNSVSQFAGSSFAKSHWSSPISVLESNLIKIYHDNTFIVNSLLINYIRKPRLVNISLGYSCDLPIEFHQKICDLASEYIKQTIGDPNYQWKLQDNQLRG